MQSAHRCEIFHQDRPTFSDNDEAVWGWLSEHTNVLDSLDVENASGVGWISLEDLEMCLKKTKPSRELRQRFEHDIDWARNHDKGGLYYHFF